MFRNSHSSTIKKVKTVGKKSQWHGGATASNQNKITNATTDVCPMATPKNTSTTSTTTNATKIDMPIAWSCHRWLAKQNQMQQQIFVTASKQLPGQ